MSFKEGRDLTEDERKAVEQLHNSIMTTLCSYVVGKDVDPEEMTHLSSERTSEMTVALLSLGIVMARLTRMALAIGMDDDEIVQLGISSIAFEHKMEADSPTVLIVPKDEVKN